MADQPATPTPWLDLLGEDIPVVDKSGKKFLLKGLDFVDQTKIPAAAPAATDGKPQTPALAAARPAAVPPPNLPVIDEAVFAPKMPAAPAQPASTRADFGLEPEADLADIKKIEERPASKVNVAEEKRELPLLESMVENAVSGTGVTLADDDMKRRYRLLISLFFRELRDALETKSKFTMSVQSGGMGMTDADAERVIADLVARNNTYHDKLAGKAADDKAGYVAKRTEMVLTAQDKIDKNEKEKGDKAFEKLAERVGMQKNGAALPSGLLPSDERAAAEAKAPQKTVEPKVIIVTGTDTVAPKVMPAVPAALKTVPVQKSPAPLPPPRTVAPTSAPMPPASPRPVSKPPQAAPVMAPSPQRPLMSDVVVASRLTGPVEELRSITVKDFRRLSRDPKEATLKIKDKIDLLEEQSFEVKTQGVKAWQDSETNRLYLDILRASLEGVPIPEVISSLEDGGKPFLTKPEFDAVMDLNRKLRFG